MRGLFVTGTDTGCGKTTVGIALIRAAQRQGLRTRVLKPIETGCRLRAGVRVAADAQRLAEAAGDDRPAAQLCAYALPLAAAPEVAARAAGTKIDVVRIETLYRQARHEADWVLVEGAGGLRVPLGAGLDMAALAGLLKLPVLLVARATLGTWNHTLLSLEAAARSGLEVTGVVISHTTARLSDADAANLEGLLAGLPARLLATLPHGAADLVPEPDLRALLGAPACA